VHRGQRPFRYPAKRARQTDRPNVLRYKNR
jgi:hypothetical protein